MRFSLVGRTGRRAAAAAVSVLVLATVAPAQVAQEAVDLDLVSRIREEGLERSQIERLAHELTDVNGPRLTGSPGMKRANEWAASTLGSWGLENVQVEPWGEFGRGWEEVSYAGRILTPWTVPLTARASGWTGSTDGTVQGPAVIVQVDSVQDLANWKGKLKGAFVLASEPTTTPLDFDPRPLRTPLDDLLGPPQTEPGRPQMDPAERQRRIEQWRRRMELQSSVDSMLRAEGAAVLLVPSSRPYTLIRGGGSRAGRQAGTPEPLPQLVVSQEQYGMIWRNVSGGTPVRIEANVQNRFTDDDLQAYNTLADLPGTDLADEYVMIGGHLDSWHYGTGATDDASGSIVMMEAMRILKSLGVAPRRTIRIGLWSGEEQGLLGSRGWVQKHPDLNPKISAYLNVDNGAGRIRGIWDQSNERAIPIFEQILWPFQDLGVVAVKHGNTGGTDHLAFDAAGIPGFNFIQDPLDYGTHTHHTAADTYERLPMDDLKQAAVVVAFTAWELANRDEMVPRKPAPETTAER